MHYAHEHFGSWSNSSPDLSLSVNDEGSPVGHPHLGAEHPVGLGYLLVPIGQHGQVHGAQPAPGLGGTDPGVVCEVRVHGAGQHLATKGAELGRALREGQDLGGAHEGEVVRVEEEEEVLAGVVGQGDLGELEGKKWQKSQIITHVKMINVYIG